jgi:hypothetical protein
MSHRVDSLPDISLFAYFKFASSGIASEVKIGRSGMSNA